jgi:uncharacterized protein (TIGR03437 family)
MSSHFHSAGPWIIKLIQLWITAVVVASAGLCQHVTAIENAASNIPPDFDYGIAQGALFVVYGSNLGPANLAIATSFPLPKTLGGTSITVTVGGTTVQAIMYYALATQVAAILPSTTPVGNGILTLTTGSGSSSLAITVIANNIGMFTVSATGGGDAVATLPNNTLVTPTNAPNPGDAVILWATGLGPVSFDETNPAVQFDMSNIPLQVYVGGKPANILFQGRNACCSAVDTVVFTVPPDVTTGCAVSVIMQIGSIVSNTATIPIAAGGRTCTPTNPALSQADFLQLLAKGSPLSIGQLSLARTSRALGVDGATVTVVTSDSGSGQFARYTTPASAVMDTVGDILAYGSCAVFPSFGQEIFSPKLLDTGPSLGVFGPSAGGINVDENIPKQVSANGTVYRAAFDNSGTTLFPGQYRVESSGGADVGGFAVRLTAPPALTWTNRPQVVFYTVKRSAGVTINWTGGDPAGYVLITGTNGGRGNLPANTDSNGTPQLVQNGIGFTCVAKTTDKTFTVPPSVLLRLGPSPNGEDFGTLSVYAFSAPVRFTAPGLDLGFATSYTLSTYSGVDYQ